MNQWKSGACGQRPNARKAGPGAGRAPNIFSASPPKGRADPLYDWLASMAKEPNHLRDGQSRPENHAGRVSEIRDDAIYGDGPLGTIPTRVNNVARLPHIFSPRRAWMCGQPPSTRDNEDRRRPCVGRRWRRQDVPDDVAGRLIREHRPAPIGPNYIIPVPLRPTPDPGGADGGGARGNGVRATRPTQAPDPRPRKIPGRSCRPPHPTLTLQRIYERVRRQPQRGCPSPRARRSRSCVRPSSYVNQKLRDGDPAGSAEGSKSGRRRAYGRASIISKSGIEIMNGAACRGRNGVYADNISMSAGSARVFLFR